MKKFEKVEKTGFLGLILRFSNLNVLHKGVLLQDWVFRLGHNNYKRLPIQKFEIIQNNVIMQSIKTSVSMMFTFILLILMVLMFLQVFMGKSYLQGDKYVSEWWVWHLNQLSHAPHILQASLHMAKESW